MGFEPWFEGWKVQANPMSRGRLPNTGYGTDPQGSNRK